MIVAVAVALTAGIVVGYLLGSRAGGSPAAGASIEAHPSASDQQLPAALVEAVNHLEIGLVVVSPAGATVFRNPAASRWSGTHAGVLVDEHLDRILERARSGRRVVTSLELHGPPKLTFALVAEPMPGGAAVATVRDVSEQVRSDAVRTDFVANISHELKTPVGALAVLAEALIDETDPAVIDRLSGRMVDESHRAARTIDDLLELSRIEVAPREDEAVALDAVVRAAVGRGRDAAEGRSITVETVDATDGVRVHGDRRQLVSALGNLVENAVKYSRDGGTVQVRTRADERFVEVMVADHGIGIPERDLDRVFERFYRVDKGRSRETGGTGLGLAIVRHVATNHGGEVVVSSAEGEGSTFALRLPASLIVVDPGERAPGGVPADLEGWSSP